MLIKINIRNGSVEITSDTALAVKQDNRDREHAAVEQVLGAIIASIGEEGSALDRPEGEPLPTNAPPDGTTDPQTVRTVGADEVVEVLKAMIEEKPQWESRSAAAVAKFMGDEVDADSVKGALDTAVYNNDLSAGTRRSGEVVYSVN